MSVARPRDVFGPARQLKGWWAADQVGKPLTLAQAFWLRRLPRDRHRLPGVVARGLARRGLLVPAGAALVLTDAGERLKGWLGVLPPDLLEEHLEALPGVLRRSRLADAVSLGPLETPVGCSHCERSVPAELVAWGWWAGQPSVLPRLCIRCAIEEADRA